VPKLALYEPPYGSSDDKDKREFAERKKRMSELVEKGKRGDAVAFFIAGMGTPPEAIEDMRKTPDWKVIEEVERTLAYDYAVMGDSSVPLDIARAVTVPTLVMDGSKSFEFMHEAADTLGRAMPNAERATLEGRTHDVAPEALAPILTEFFKA
jgi:pimeloyl-ACP methyl ester carboxylesterase